MGSFYCGQDLVFVVYWYDATDGALFLWCRMRDQVSIIQWVRAPFFNNIVPIVFVAFLIASCGEASSPSPEAKPSLQETSATTIPSHTASDLSSLLSQSDLVVFGRIDACWVCQFDPQPHVSYAKILAGDITQEQEGNSLLVVSIPERFLPEGGVPIYKSQKEEICFLKRNLDVRFEGKVPVYDVVDIWKANDLSLFDGL